MYKRLLIFGIIVFYFIFSYRHLAANNSIKGIVVDAQTRKPLPNANIMIEGTHFGTASDLDGKFSIKNIPPGNFKFRVNFIGYKFYEKQISFMLDQTLLLEVLLEPIALKGEEVVVTAKADAYRAKVRETPIAFTTLELKELKENYTTGDLPDLIQNVPGVWTSSAGLGETEIKIRGFSSDKVRFLVNGVPMNEAEDQQVYWSNWTGLSNMVRSIQVHRGAGFSLYGTGAFGGSVHIETIGVSERSGSFMRFSTGAFNRMGIASGPREGLVAQPENGNGFVEVGKAVNYTYSCRLNSGPMLGNKLNASVYLEYKTGDSYLFGTGYNGITLAIEAQSILKNHQLDLTFFTSPQGHNQAFALQDIDLLETLGREYNRKRHEWQENYYRKPFLNLKHEWKISEKQTLVSNGFFSVGKGTDQTVTNDIFDVKTGTIDFQGASQRAMGYHALYLYQKFGIKTTDFFFSPDGSSFKYDLITGSANLFSDQHEFGWQDRRKRDHTQFGISTFYQYNIFKSAKIIIGGESRFWRGHRTREAWTGAFHDNYQEGWRDFGEYPTGRKLQNIYDYNTEVNNLSTFGRFSVTPLNFLTIQAGGQYYYAGMKVIENPIQFFDFGKSAFFEDAFFRTTADQKDSVGNFLYSKEDYQRTYKYFTPWIGSNLNFTKNANLFINVAAAKNEPTILNWYDFDKGPQFQQIAGKKLKPESALSTEFGVGYQIALLKASANYYRTQFKDKIESVVDFDERSSTINAGEALFQGIEFEFQGEIGRLDFMGSATFSRNRWQKMEIQQIFNANAKDVEGKVVPFSPERMFNASIGYRFTVHQDHNYRAGLDINFWDEYYGTYTNEYRRADGLVYWAKLPYFLDIGAHLSFTKSFPKTDLTFRIDANNLLNRKDNFFRAQYTIDYGRQDYFQGKYHWYVLQAPLFNIFFTAEVAVR